jgi:hypothetical protein
MSETTESLNLSDPIYARLEDQIGWYDRKASSAQHTFKRIKIVEILAAALIPFLAALNTYHKLAGAVTLVTGGLGVVITILEGILHLNQYQQLWTSYRSTCEGLKHEKFTYLGHAEPYASAADPRALLTERVETLLSQENVGWTSSQQQAAKVTTAT